MQHPLPDRHRLPDTALYLGEVAVRESPAFLYKGKVYIAVATTLPPTEIRKTRKKKVFRSKNNDKKRTNRNLRGS